LLPTKYFDLALNLTQYQLINKLDVIVEYKHDTKTASNIVINIKIILVFPRRKQRNQTKKFSRLFEPEKNFY